ncbi:hypothetical protein C8Q80DRAFT_635313 [Daedaleopsis nitida]|nr:hypothetical protein C8Q80DRAFT_635313 [Daedaleopsis nitida]
MLLLSFFLSLSLALHGVDSHISIWHPSMYGFNVTDSTFPYDNRPVVPLMDMTFDQWWFHGHLDYPPNPGDFFELPVGQPATAELACNKGLTSYWASSEGHTDLQTGDNPCTSDDGSFPSGAMHTTGFDDLKGCALAIAYESDPKKIQPEDFAVFSVNQTCVWNRFTDFQVPERMPPCPEDGCHCAFFWIHSIDSGGEQSMPLPQLGYFLFAWLTMLPIADYMNGFKCNVTGSASVIPIAKPKVPRRCGADPDYGKPDAAPGNCTYGAKQPFYWFQAERNNMFEGTYAPPYYLDLYNFKDGAQNDIFVDSYADIPVPSPDQTVVPTPLQQPQASATAAPPSAPIPPLPTNQAPFGTPPGRCSACKLRRPNDTARKRSLFNFEMYGHKKQRAFSLWHPF